MKSVFKKTVSVIGCTAGILLIIFAAAQNNSFGRRQIKENPVNISTEKLSTNVPAVQLRTEDMLEKALKSVVGISSADPATIKTNEQLQYMGSGVIVSEDGYIITNHHVIGARPKSVEVTLSDGKTEEGKTVWSNKALDLAVVKIRGEGYAFSKMGDAKALRVGESVMAIGNPLSMQFQRTVTAGIVSALGRSIDIENENGEPYYMEDLIQTDASINPGNSGGPLLNLKGEVVGVNTVKVSSAEGMGFAVPINVCVPVVERLRLHGKFQTPYLGLYAYTPAAARYFGNNDVSSEGLFAAKLDSDGPAYKAGLRYGDIITEINQKKVSTMLQLREELYKYQSGNSVKIKYIRHNKINSVTVKLEKMPE